MFAPTGMFVSLNAPFESVSVVTSGSPVSAALHWSQLAPVEIAAGVPFGTYTYTFGSGFLPAGS